MEDRLEEYSKIENLLDAYSREVLGEFYTGTNGFTVEKLIVHSLLYRKMNEIRTNVFAKAIKTVIKQV